MAARLRAELGPDCPKWPFLGPKTLILAWNLFFVDSLKKIVTIMTGHLKDNRIAGWGGRQGPFLAQNCPKNLIFLHYTHITNLFWAQTDMTQWDHIFPISWSGGRKPNELYLMVLHSFACILHCIVWYCMVSYYIWRYCMVLYWCWLRCVGYISQNSNLLSV